MDIDSDDSSNQRANTRLGRKQYPGAQNQFNKRKDQNLLYNNSASIPNPRTNNSGYARNEYRGKGFVQTSSTPNASQSRGYKGDSPYYKLGKQDDGSSQGYDANRMSTGTSQNALRNRVGQNQYQGEYFERRRRSQGKRGYRNQSGSSAEGSQRSIDRFQFENSAQYRSTVESQEPNEQPNKRNKGGSNYLGDRLADRLRLGPHESNESSMGGNYGAADSDEYERVGKYSTMQTKQKPPLALNPQRPQKQPKPRQLPSIGAAADSGKKKRAGFIIDKSLAGSSEDFGQVDSKDQNTSQPNTPKSTSNPPLRSQKTVKFGSGGWQQLVKPKTITATQKRPKGGMNLWKYLTQKLLKKQWGSQKEMDINAIMYRQRQLVKKQRGEKSETDFDDWSFEEDSQLSINIISDRKPRKEVGWAGLQQILRPKLKDPLEAWRKIIIKANKNGMTKIHFNLRSCLTLVQPHLDQRRPVIIRWEKATEFLLEKSFQQRKVRVAGRWKGMIQTLGKRGELQLKTFADMGVQGVITRLKASGEKARTLKAIGNWNKLIKGVQAGNKNRSLYLCGKWRQFAKKLLVRDDFVKNQANQSNKTHQLNAVGRWGYLVEIMLKRQSIFNLPALRKNAVTNRWRRLVEGLAFEHGNKGLWLNINHMISMDNVQRRMKQRRLNVLSRWNRLIKGLLKSEQRPTTSSLDPIARWGLLISLSRKAEWRAAVVDSRWRRLVKAGANRGLFSINFDKYLKGMKKKLTAANVKVRTLKILGRWRILCNGLLQRYPDGSRTKGSKAVRGSGLSVTERWTNLMVKVQAVMREEGLSKTDWNGAIKNINTQVIEKGRKTRQLMIFGKWAQFSRGILKKYYQRRGTIARISWVRLSRKLLQKEKLRRQKVLGRWNRMARDLLKASGSRTLFVHRRLKRLVKKYIIYTCKRRSMLACTRLSRLSRKLLAKHEREQNQPNSTTPMERWTILAQKALERINKDRGKVSWMAGARALKKDVLDPARKRKTMNILGRWKVLIDGVLGLPPKNKGMVIAFKWRRIVNQLLKKNQQMSGEEKTRILGVYGRWRTLTRGVLDLKDGKRGKAGTRHLAICAKWFKMADRMLCRHDRAYRETRVQERWNRLIGGLFSRGRLNDPTKWRKILSKNPLAVPMQNSKGRRQRIYSNNVERWTALVRKMIGPNFAMLMGAVGVNSCQSRWNRLIGKLLRRNPSIAGGLWIKKFSGKSVQQKTRPTLPVIERWKIMVEGLAYRYGLQLNKNDFYSKLKDTLQKDSTPDVRNLKVKKIKYKDSELAQQNIRIGKERLERSRADQDPGVINQLKGEINDLQSKIGKYQDQMAALEEEMQQKCNKANEEVERGNQRENKLMFFLYVLKEERKCPVTEVYEDYIKPIETSRFTQDYCEDFKQVLQGIKRAKKEL